MFSDYRKYDLVWNERVGFAKVAIGAKVVKVNANRKIKFISLQPIIPAFTENCRETFRMPSCVLRCLRPLYERWRIVAPICGYGGLPVKLM